MACAKQPWNIGYLINDANSGALIDTAYDKQSNKLTVSGNYYSGSVGVSHMTHNNNSTRLLTSTGLRVDIWDSSATNGSLELLGTFSSDDNSTESYTTQVVPDPSGKLCVVNDRKANSLIILSAVKDNTSSPSARSPWRRAVAPAAARSTPQTSRTRPATSLCASLLRSSSRPRLTSPQAPSSSCRGSRHPSAPTAGSGRSQTYCSRPTATRAPTFMLTNTFVSKDNGTDTIAHFRLPGPGDDESAVPGDLTDITADRIVSSGGVNPSSMCLDSEGEYLIVGNQQKGPAAIAFLKRDKETGELSEKAEATLDFKKPAKGTVVFGPSSVTPILI